MVQYLANRIIKGALDYTYVVTQRPDLKDEIDLFLLEHDREDLIIE